MKPLLPIMLLHLEFLPWPQGCIDNSCYRIVVPKCTLLESDRNSGTDYKDCFGNHLLSCRAQCSVVHVWSRNHTAEERLILHLFDGYVPSARPTYDVQEPILLNISVTLLQLVDVNEQLQTMTTNGWINVIWNDPRLTWTPSEYGGLTEISIPPNNQPWLPRFTLVNSAASDLYNLEFFLLFGVELTHTGDIFWGPGGNFFTQCSMDITFYPFDDQKCSMVFSNWIYTGDQVNLTYTENAKAELLEGYTESGSWDIIAVNITRRDDLWGYPEVTFQLHLKRKRLFYVSSLLIPCSLLSVLAMFVFHLPPESGEKISLCTSLLLSFVVYIMVLSENLPTTSTSVPIIQLYLLMAVTCTAMTVIISIFVLKTYHKSDVTPPPDILLKLCFIGTSKVGIMNNSDQKLDKNGMLHQGEINTKINNFVEETKVDSLNPKDPSVMMILRRILEIMESNEQEKASNNESQKNRELWIKVANFIDRICFILFALCLILGTLVILVIIPSSG